jgi:hypothetical protein
LLSLFPPAPVVGETGGIVARPAADDPPVSQIRVAVEIGPTCHLPEQERSWPMAKKCFLEIVLLKKQPCFFNSVVLGPTSKFF